MQNFVRLLTLSILGAFVAFAQPARADMATLRSLDNGVWLSAGTSLLGYQEYIPPSDGLSDSEHGWLTSAAAGASTLLGGEGHGLANNLYLAGEGSISFGNANYNGAYINSSVPLHSTTNETITTIDGKIGKGFALADSAMLIPYVELGYRYWKRDLGGGQVENYQNFDTLGGMMLQISPIDRLLLSVYGSAGTTLAARMQSPTDDFNLGNAGMYKFGGKIGYGLTQHIELFTTLDYDHFRYAQSPILSDRYYEPSSQTSDTAWRVGLGYHFR